jgi:cellulose synthase/poly-beta-1,6-N-acetylglucosamine synthase-like glycosyltransferase
LCRLLLLAGAVIRSNARRALAVPTLSDAELPTYAVLVPLFREAAILPDLVEALAAIDYPRAKLDIALILEESDRPTRAAASRAELPPHMRVIVVPDRQPRTKPRALATALGLTRGELVAVYDAEDIPAVNQLRAAAAAFAREPGRYACLQARLAIYNPRQSWITRHFTLEYAALFHALLPAIVRLGWPVPLSGTSNHFVRAVLDQCQWDPFNVTEDAELGIRLTRRGGGIGLLDSDT